MSWIRNHSGQRTVPVLETIGMMASFTFSRIWPARSEQMERLPSGEYPEMLSLISEYYRDYTLFVPDPIFKDGNYYVIRDSGRVVAGIQYYPVTWRIIDFGSKTGNWFVGLLSRLKWLRKRYNPEEMKLLAFDGIYCEKGYENELYELMEGMLFETGTYVAIIMADIHSDLYSIYMKEKKLGIIHRVLGSFRADIRARFINIPDQVRNHFISHPTYIPTYDNS